MRVDPEVVRDVLVDALEQAGFKGTWEYGGNTALGSAIETAEIVVAALIEAGILTETGPE